MQSLPHWQCRTARRMPILVGRQLDLPCAAPAPVNHIGNKRQSHSGSLLRIARKTMAQVEQRRAREAAESKLAVEQTRRPPSSRVVRKPQAEQARLNRTENRMQIHPG
jgi:hypothetical protein